RLRSIRFRSPKSSRNAGPSASPGKFLGGLPLQRLLSSLATIWRLSLPYFRSEDRWPGRILLAAVIGLELSTVAITVALNYWYNYFYNALQDRNWSSFWWAILIFCILASI